VVGGLVEHEEVLLVGRMALAADVHEHPGEGDALALPAREVGDLHVQRRAHPEAVEHRGTLPPAAHDGGDRARRELGHLVEHRRPAAPAAAHRAVLRCHRPGEDPEQRRLAAAVDPDDAEAVAAGHGDGQAVEQQLARTAGSDPGGVDEDHRGILPDGPAGTTVPPTSHTGGQMDTPGAGPDNADDTSGSPPPPPPTPSWGAPPSGGATPPPPPAWGPPPTRDAAADETAAVPITPGVAAAAGIPITAAAADEVTEELFAATGPAGAGTPPPPPPGGADTAGAASGDDGGDRRVKRNRRLLGAALVIFLAAAAVTAVVTSDDDDGGDDDTDLAADADSTTSTRRSTTTTRRSTTTTSTAASSTSTSTAVTSTTVVTSTTKASNRATTATTRRARASRFGDDPTLDRLYRECEAGNFQSCDDLYDRTDAGTEYNEFGDTCGNRNAPDTYCVVLYDQGVPDTYGEDARLDGFWDRCASNAADFAAACDQLYNESGVGTQYERFGETCGNRLASPDPLGRSCQELY
jgi:hypothetical protein